MATIALSAGHQLGVDNGAAYNGLLEADLTIQIAKRATEILRAHSVGVLYVPDNLSLEATISWINARASQLDLCVDVHINSGNGTGVEAWHYQGAGESKTLSIVLANNLSAETGLRNRGVKDETTNRHGRLGFVHDTVPLASLVECGFIDGDYAFLSRREGIEKMARGVARGCLSYLGIAWRPSFLTGAPSTPHPVPVNTAVNYEAIGKEAERYIFGFKTEGTPTERLAKAQGIYKKHGARR